MDTVTQPAAAQEVTVGRSRWVNILPIAFIMYTIAYFDRSNLGLALPYITKDLGLTPVQAGLAGGVFAWGYALAQLVSGWLTLRFGARNLIGICLLLWGAGALGTGLVHTFPELLALRVLLGVFEGPVFAACSLLLSQWFMKPERGRAFGIWNLSSPLGAFLAGPISGALLAHYDWRLMFVAEGLPAWIWAVLWWWRIPSSMARAQWLPAAERAHVQAVLAEEQAQMVRPVGSPTLALFRSPALWLTLIGFSLVNFLISGFQLWLPTALKSDSDLSIVAIGWIAGLPFIASMVGMFVITRHSDRHGQERRWHSAVPTVLTGVLLIGAAFVPPRVYLLQVALFIVLGFTMKAFLPLIFARLTEILPREQAVPAIAIINGLANLFGGFVGPVLFGYLRGVTDGFAVPFAVLGIAGALGGMMFAAIRPVRRPAPPPGRSQS